MPTRFRSIECPSCKHVCDGMDSKCPECGEELPRTKGRSFDAVARIPYGRQFGLFVAGYIGLTVLATILAIFVNIAYTGFTLRLHRLQLVNTITYLIAYPILLIILGLIAGPKLKTALPSFRKASAYLAGFLGFVAIIFFDIVYGTVESSILRALGHAVTTNTNQSNVNAIIQNFPLTGLLVLGIIGPICEELTYRVGLFGLCSRIGRWFAYLVTALFFGFIHITFSGDLVVELLSLPSYVFAGLVFGFLYDRFGLAASLSAHVLNNCLSLIFTLII